MFVSEPFSKPILPVEKKVNQNLNSVSSATTETPPPQSTTSSIGEDTKKTGSYSGSEQVKDPSELTFNVPNKDASTRSLYRSTCIFDGVKLATGLSDINMDSSDSLSEATLKKVTGKKWDGIDFSKYPDLSKLATFFAEKDDSGKLSINSDVKLTPKKDTLISDGAHVYVLKDFQYKLGENGKPEMKNGKPVITGFIVTDPVSGEEHTITSKEIKSSKNITAFVQERDNEKKVGDGYASHKADGRSACRYSDIVSSKTLFNSIDKEVGSESQNIRLFFSALGDPRQKANVASVIKEINALPIAKDGNFTGEGLIKLQTLIKQKLKVDIPIDELEGMAKIFKTDISSMATDSSTKKIIESIKSAKAGGGAFLGLNKMFFNGAGSPKDKITVADLFLLMQSEKSFASMPTGAKLNADKASFDLPVGSKVRPGGVYLDTKTNEIYEVKSFTDGKPPKAEVKKLDGIGRQEHNYYQMGMQFVNLSFEDFGSDPKTSTEVKAKSLLDNFDKLIRGLEGC